MRSTDTDFDCIIIGAGLAGNAQARHLLLNIPGIRLALIDPRSELRGDKDLKVGESLIEVASLFLMKELGLHDYLIENHTPKLGLNFHWPKDPDKTDTIDDYFHIWTPVSNPIPSFHINRAKLETDLLAMNKAMSVKYYAGHATDVNITEGDQPNTVVVKSGQQTFTLSTKHVVDAAGRKFLLGKKLDNLITDPKELFGVRNCASWLRVRNIDRALFEDGYHPDRCAVTGYYATNHWFGDGYWVWMIPSANKPSLELSIGVVFHEQCIAYETLNTKDKLLAFLRENQNLLYKLIQSGDSVDFMSRRQLAYRSTRMFSEDNWYVLGDSANMPDPFYSPGITLIAFAVESITEIIRSKREQSPETSEKIELYNSFNVYLNKTSIGVYRYHDRQLGHASAMSWRIFLESMLYFSVTLPMYVGKWHLQPQFLKTAISSSTFDEFREDVYADLNRIIDGNHNIGFLDVYRGDQLFGDYVIGNGHSAYIENGSFYPESNNILRSLKWTSFYSAIWYLKFQRRVFRATGSIRFKKFFSNVAKLTLGGITTHILDQQYKFRTRRAPNNRDFAKQIEEFKAYRFRPGLRPWNADTARESHESAS